MNKPSNNYFSSPSISHQVCTYYFQPSLASVSLVKIVPSPILVVTAANRQIIYLTLDTGATCVMSLMIANKLGLTINKTRQSYLS